MGERTIATHCGGELQIGGGPQIDGVIHGWVYGEGGRAERGPYGFMLGHAEGRELSRALQLRHETEIRTFTGKVRVTHADGLAHLWFYTWGQESPERVCRLYEGAREAAAAAIREVVEDAEVAPCSFCRKAAADVDRMIGIPGGQRMCGECIELANEGRRRAAAA